MSAVAKKRRLNQSQTKGLDSTHYPHHGELSLFDLPKLLRDCMDTLHDQGIGRAQFIYLMIGNDGRLQLHISYFAALLRLPAEVFKQGVDVNGRYCCYRLFVNHAIDVVWIKRGAYGN